MPVRVLLDENLPERLRLHFESPIEASTVRFLGWKGKRNGDLLRAAEEAGFDVLLTLDQGIPSEQEVSRLRLAVVVLEARSNRYADLASGAEKIRRALNRVRAGTVVCVPV